jgi:hypothetical protein
METEKTPQQDSGPRPGETHKQYQDRIESERKQREQKARDDAQKGDKEKKDQPNK